MRGFAAFIATSMLMALPACSPTTSRAEAVPEVPTNLYRLISEQWGPQALAQCSRWSPTYNGSFWQPDARQIDRLELALGQVLADPPSTLAAAETEDRKLFQATRPTDFARERSTYLAEYIGYRSEDRQLIYGNFQPYFDFSEVEIPADLQDAPSGACDGGYAFFGIVYDPERNLIIRLDFNGSVIGPMLDSIILAQ